MIAHVKGTLKDVYAWENLLSAWRAAAKGKRGKADAAAFEYRLEDNLLELGQELKNERYRPGGYENFLVFEPKRRLISASPFRDRVVHHALCQVIEPAFERSFIAHSYANRVGKGTHRAIDKCQALMRKFRYVLMCDVRQFFPSIDHQILEKILFRHIQHGGLRRLIHTIIQGGTGVLAGEYDPVYFTGDDLFAITRPRGLPIGNLTSQFWANCYLDGFDHFVNRTLGCGAYLRYMDDFLLFSDSKSELWRWRLAIMHKLAGLRLKLHEKRAQTQPTSEGLRFLGFVIFPSHRLLLRRKGIAYKRRLREMLKLYESKKIDRDTIKTSIQGWINHVRYGDTWGLRKNMLKGVVL